MTQPELRKVRREIEAWARRPPARSPATARARVRARIGDRRPRPLRRLAAAAAVVAAVGALALLVDSVGPRPSPVPREEAGPTQRLLVYELESGTKIYYAFPPVQRSGNGLLR